LRDRAQLHLAFQDVEGLLFQPDHLARGLDLRAQGGVLHRRGDDVRGQGQVGGVQLEALRFGLRGQGLHLAPVGAEDVGRVAHRHLRREQVVDGGAGGQSGLQYAGGIAIAGGIETCLHQREVTAALRSRILECLAQRRLRRQHLRIGTQRLFDQLVELRIAERRPPISRYVRVGEEALSSAGRALRGTGFVRKPLARVALRLRGRGAFEIRADARCRERAQAGGRQDAGMAASRLPGMAASRRLRHALRSAHHGPPPSPGAS
jgi:hypothetical protein